VNKRPRDYFADIFKLPVKEWGIAVEKDVPEEFKEWVRIYLRRAHQIEKDKRRKNNEQR